MPSLTIKSSALYFYIKSITLGTLNLTPYTEWKLYGELVSDNKIAGDYNFKYSENDLVNGKFEVNPTAELSNRDNSTM